MARPETLMWSEHLKDRIPVINGVDTTDPESVISEWKLADRSLKNAFNRCKLLATVAWNRGWASTPEKSATMTMLADWLANNYSFSVSQRDVREMVTVVSATYWFGEKCRKWIDGFGPSVQYEIAKYLRVYIIKADPTEMSEGQLDEHQETIERVMKACPPYTAYSRVYQQLVEAEILPRIPGKALERKRKEEEEENDPESLVLSVLRNSEDGFVGGMFIPRFLKQPAKIETVLANFIEQMMRRNEMMTRDQALFALCEAGAKSLGLPKD